jgi:hypothetical protein
MYYAFGASQEPSRAKVPDTLRALLLDISGGCAAFYGATPALFIVFL